MLTTVKKTNVHNQNKCDIFCEILSSNKDLTFIIDLQKYQFEYISQKSQEFLGLNPQELYKMGPQRFFNLVHPDDIDQMNNEVEKMQGCHFLTDIKYRIIFGVTGYRWVSEKRQILYSKHNKPVYLISKFKDAF